MKQNKNKRRSGSLEPDSISASVHGLPVLFATLWAFGLAFVFFTGRHLGDRAPRLTYIVSFLNLASYAGRILADGLAYNLFLAVTIWFVFWTAGDAFIRKMSLQGATAPERVLISGGLGAGIASIAMLVLGLAGYWTPAHIRLGFVSVVIFSAVVAIYRGITRGDQADNLQSGITAEKGLSYSSIAALILIAAAFTLSLLASAAPETFYDALVYHLALPKLYLLRGQVVPTPHNLYSGFPFGMQMLYGLCLALSNEHLAILLHYSFGCVAAAAAYFWLRRYSSRNAAVTGVLIFSLSPITIASGWQSGVELAVALFASLALLAISRALHAVDAIQSRSWSLVSGILLGFLVGTKYTAVPLAAAFIMTYAWLRKREVGWVMDTAWMTGAAILIFSPWPIKNFFFYGNPLYPFFSGLIGSVKPALWDLFLSDAHSLDWAATFRSAGGWKALLFLPWSISVDQFMNYRISLAYLMLLPWTFPIYRQVLEKDSSVEAAVKAGGIIVLSGYLAWCMTSNVARFLVPTLLLGSAVLALGLYRTQDTPWARRPVVLLILWISTCNFIATYLDGFPGRTGKWAVLTQHQSKEEYLQNSHAGYGQPYFAAMEFINKNLPPSARVAFVGESRSFYCDRDFIAATNFDHNPFWIAAQDSGSPEEFHAKLKSLGITHIFLNVFQLHANSEFPTVLPREVASRNMFSEFWNGYLSKIFENRKNDSAGRIKDWLVVYELKDSFGKNRERSSDNPIETVLGQLRNTQSPGR